MYIINDIIDLSKIEAGHIELHPRPFSLRGCLEAAFYPLERAAADKGLGFEVEVSPDIPDCLYGDQSRLRQILENIVGNAVKFTHQGTVSIALRIAEDLGERLRLLCTITDTGIGIPEEERRSIFESFGQAKPALQAQYGGSGLGLAICTRYLEMMAGEIWCTSTEGCGSTFAFTAVLERCSGEEGLGAEVNGQAAEPLPGLKILVAEDSPMNQLFTREILKEQGHEVVLASDGREALQALAEGGFNLVLMDIRMPNLGGEEALQVIRQEPPAGVDPSVPVIALTAHSMQGDRERLLEQGFDAYLSKPIDIRSFEKIIAESVMGRQPPKGPSPAS
jgi:CheY-like chemotaxis protein